MIPSLSPGHCVTRRTVIARGLRLAAGGAAAALLPACTTNVYYGDSAAGSRWTPPGAPAASPGRWPTKGTIQDWIDSAAENNTGIVWLPPGIIEVDEPVRLRQGVSVIGQGAQQGAGSGGRPGTSIMPSRRFSGAAGVWVPPKGVVDRDKFWHGGLLTNLAIRNFPGHGILIEGAVGENSLIDRVALRGNKGDGMHFAAGHGSTPVMMGRFHATNNGGSGIRLRIPRTHMQFLYIGGDNNGEALVTVENASGIGNLRILGWKAERWGKRVGHPDVFVLNNLNGSVVDLGIGHVHVPPSTPVSSGTIVHMKGRPGKVRFLYGLNPPRRPGYALGFKQDSNGVEIPAIDLHNKEFSTIPAYADRSSVPLALPLA